jgi:hypothetical protein
VANAIAVELGQGGAHLKKVFMQVGSMGCKSTKCWLVDVSAWYLSYCLMSDVTSVQIRSDDIWLADISACCLWYCLWCQMLPVSRLGLMRSGWRI